MKLRYSVDLNVTAVAAWAAIHDQFGAAGTWTSLLSGSRMVGPVAVGSQRVCDSPQYGRAVEKITHIDAGNMTLDYALTEGGPAFMTSGRNRWRVQPLGRTTCRVILTPEVELTWWATPMLPLVRFGLNGSMRKVLEEFKHWAETGEVHPRKKGADTAMSARAA